MARVPNQAMVLRLQEKLFNKLCTAYRRSHRDSAFCISAKDAQREFGVPDALFVEALDKFVDASGDRIVMVIEREGEKYLSLSESARFNLNED